MTLTFLLLVAGIAMVDSLNPTATAIHIYLLSASRTAYPALAFILGKFITNYLAGYLALLGLGVLVSDWLARIDPPDANMRLAVGIVLVVAGLVVFRRQGEVRPQKPKSLRALSTCLMGIATTLAELPTAAPYWAAIALIAQARLDFTETHLVLFAYNILFVSPLITLCGIHLALEKKGQPFLARTERWIARWFPQALRLALIAVGVWLIADVAVHRFD